MGLRIATNIQSMAAQRHLTKAQDHLNSSFEKLSSGSRINKSADDAAGLAISEKLRASIRSLKQAGRNANDGISLIQTAEGSFNEISNVLIRLRELSIQSASDTVGEPERQIIDKEVQQLKKEVDRIAVTTEFNGYKLLTGQTGNLEIQVGNFNRPDQDRLIYDTDGLRTSTETLGLTQISAGTREASQNNLDSLDGAIQQVNANRANLGALQNRLASTINNINVYTENLSAANSRMRDADMALESSELTKGQILSQAGVSVLSQANQNAGLAVKLLG